MNAFDLAIAGLVFFFVSVIGYLIWHKKRIRETWTSFANTHGLTLELGTYPRAHGEIAGRRFEIGSYVGRSASGREAPGRVVEFMIKAAINGAVPKAFVAGERGWMQGPESVQTGDAEFDREVWVDCPDPAAGAAYLTPERRAIVRRASDAGYVLLGPSEEQSAVLVFSRTGYKVDLGWFEAQRAKILDLAAELDA